MCAIDIVDENEENRMSICIPSDYCGIEGNYISEMWEITFATTEIDSCVKSSYDAFREGDDCSDTTDGCSSGLVCALDIADEQENN